MADTVFDEPEVKFDRFAASDGQVVEAFRPAASSGGALIERLAPRAVLDIYLDTETGALLERNATLRVRTRAGKSKFNANFKPPPSSEGYALVRPDFRPDVMLRSEHSGSVSAKRLRKWQRGDADERSGTLDAAAAYLHGAGVSPGDLRPTVWMESSRHVYFVRDPDDRVNPLVVIILEDVRAIDVTSLPPRRLLDDRTVDVDEPLPEIRMTSSEIEVVGAAPGEPRAVAVFDRMIQCLHDAGATILQESKYTVARRRLAQVGGRDSSPSATHTP